MRGAERRENGGGRCETERGKRCQRGTGVQEGFGVWDLSAIAVFDKEKG